MGFPIAASSKTAAKYVCFPCAAFDIALALLYTQWSPLLRSNSSSWRLEGVLGAVLPIYLLALLEQPQTDFFFFFSPELVLKQSSVYPSSRWLWFKPDVAHRLSQRCRKWFISISSFQDGWMFLMNACQWKIDSVDLFMSSFWSLMKHKLSKCSLLLSEEQLCL